MFSKSLFCSVLGLLLSFTTQATLVGDSIAGIGSGLSEFNGPDVVVSHDPSSPAEFDGYLSGTITTDPADPVEIFDVSFNFRADHIDDTLDVLFIDIEAQGESGALYTLDFFVTFSDLNWDSEPDRVLSGLNHRADDSYVSFGQGLTPPPTVEDRSFTLHFTDFEVIESRYLEIELLTTIDTTISNPDPVPVPPAVGLGLVGMGLVGLTRRSRQHNKVA